MSTNLLIAINQEDSLKLVPRAAKLGDRLQRQVNESLNGNCIMRDKVFNDQSYLKNIKIQRPQKTAIKSEAVDYGT